MVFKCPKHQMEVVPMWQRTEEVKTGYKNIVRGLTKIVISKCPVFGCGYSIESDEYGVLIRDSEGTT
jgi:hypothetical protein